MFIHDAILESVTCGDTQIAATNLRVAISKMNKKDRLSQLNIFQNQFKVGVVCRILLYREGVAWAELATR